MGLTIFANLTDGLNALSLFDQSFALVSAGGGNQRSVTGSGGLPIVSTDAIINLNCSAPLTITLPSASSRSGAPLVFKDVGGKAGANTITIQRAGSDLIDGLTSVTMTTNYQLLKLVPANDGVTTGWSIQ